MNSYEINNLAETNGYRLSCDAAGVWSLIRKSDRQVTVVGYSIQDAVAILQPVVETVETVVETVSEAETEIEDDDTMTVGMAAMVLNDKRCGLATEEEINEAQGVMVRAVAAELRARGVTFHQDSLNDWICKGEFRGWETAESLADEWGDSDEEEEIDESGDHGYSVPEGPIDAETLAAWAAQDKADDAEYYAWLDSAYGVAK